MSLFSNHEEKKIEFNLKNIYDDILQNMQNENDFSDFHVLEKNLPEEHEWDFLLIRDVVIDQHVKKGKLGYEGIQKRTYQQIIPVSIQPQHEKKIIFIPFPHSPPLYVFSWDNFKNKLYKILADIEIK